MIKDGSDYLNLTQFAQFLTEQGLLKELKTKINYYMVYYNNYRYQWNSKKMTPIQYETAEKVHF